MMYDQTRARQPAGQARISTERRRPGPKPLVPSDGQDKTLQRLRHALNTFADTPREALEEAESAFDEATAQLANALAERRQLLRAGWQAGRRHERAAQEARPIHISKQYLCSPGQILTERADRFLAAIIGMELSTADGPLLCATVDLSCSCGSRNFKCCPVGF